MEHMTWKDTGFLMLMLLGIACIIHFAPTGKKKEAKVEEPTEKNYVIILNDDQEAMPGEGGLLMVDFFKNDTVYVSTVETDTVVVK